MTRRKRKQSSNNKYTYSYTHTYSIDYSPSIYPLLLVLLIRTHHTYICKRIYIHTQIHYTHTHGLLSFASLPSSATAPTFKLLLLKLIASEVGFASVSSSSMNTSSQKLVVERSELRFCAAATAAQSTTSSSSVAS